MTSLVAGPPNAPALVLLHGWGASKEIWKLLFRPPLSLRYRLIAFDLPGTGASDLIDPATPVALADWVVAKMESQGHGEFAVLGHSMGANIAVQMAARHPARIKALVLVAAALHSHRLSSANWYLHPLTGKVVLGGARRAAGMAGWIESLLPPSDELGWGRGYMRRSGYLMFNNTVGSLQAQLKGLLDTPADIASLPEHLPVLLIHGAKDTTIPLSWAHEAAAARPDRTELIVYPDALHCPMDTHTRQFIEDTTRFLDKSIRNTVGL